MPLAINLDRRTKAETETNALLQAQTIAASVGKERVDAALFGEGPLRASGLQSFVFRTYAHSENGRVIVITTDGVLIADSRGPANLGTRYATPQRPELVSVLRDQIPHAETRFSNTLGQSIIVAAAPVIDEGTIYGAVRLSLATGDVERQVRDTILGLIVIGLGGLLAGLIIAFGLAASFSRPLSRLAGVAERLGGGDLGTRADTTSGAREIVELAESFDEMAERLEATVKAQREFVANASHQLRTPLTGMKLRLEAAIERSSSPEDRRQLQAADKEVDRLAEIVERLLVMARRIEVGGPGEVDVSDAAQRALVRWRDRAERSGAVLASTGDPATALAERADVDQILDNLLDNAISYAAGPVTIETGTADAMVFVAVEDQGAGIAPDEIGRVTERFYRGRKAPPGGSGLGLAIVRDLAEKWNGKVDVRAPAEGGTRVEVRLPPAGAAP